VLKGIKTTLIAAVIMAVIVFIGTFIAGYYYEWPHFKEPVVMGFDEEWKIGSDIEVGVVKGSCRTIPILDFEYNGINYTTYGNTGLPANLVFLDKKSALTSANSERTFQKFYANSDNDTIYALYAVMEGNNVYYTTEKLYSKVYYEFTLEQKENKVIISHHPNILSFIINWFLLSAATGVITFNPSMDKPRQKSLNR
jgi:hypothetical protein